MAAAANRTPRVLCPAPPGPRGLPVKAQGWRKVLWDRGMVFTALVALRLGDFGNSQ